MIVRDTKEPKSGFVLIEQHHHGLLSGEFARKLSPKLTEGRLSEVVLDAIANHDRAWKSPDSKVLWNEAENRPFSFLDLPPEPKISAYTRFLDEMESENPYSGLLCSTHYGSLVAESKDPYEMRFATAEEERRERILGDLRPEDLRDFERDFAVLRLADDLSLFICLNEPGESDHPWYSNGVSFMGSRIVPEWYDERTFRFVPDILERGFDIRLPYRVVSPDGTETESNEYHMHVIRS